MSFSGMLATGLSGLNAYATSLEAVSHNIANTQTTGFKRVETNFSTLIQGLSSEGGVTAGGVEASNSQRLRDQGALVRTASQTDLAVSGDGFFVVSDAGADALSPFMFTRNGGFSVQSDGTLQNAAGMALRAAPVSADGAFSANSLGGLEIVNINRLATLAEATSRLSLEGNLSAADPAGASFTQNIQLFDAAGAARTLALTFVKTGPNAWSATAAFADGAREQIASGAIQFDANGVADFAASTFPASITIGENAGQAIDLDMSALTGYARATQLRAAADGAAQGAFTGVEISRDGRVTALFANGLTRDIYQIALANFVNAEALKEGPASTFLTHSDAGAMRLDIPQSGRAGAVEQQALEMSTVDIGQEFSTLIETQRAYSANSRVISIADELWRTLTQTAA